MAALCAGAAQAVRAQAIIYRCTLNAAPVDSFMSQDYAFMYDAQSGEAQAVDGLIWDANKKWVTVKVQTANTRRVTLGWVVRKVEGLENGLPSTLPGVRESATIVFAGMKLFVTQYPLGADNSFSAQGNCTAEPWQPRRN